MKFFIIAGEASGDLHGSNLVKQLKNLNPETEFAGWGGDLLIENGVKIYKHIRDLAFMGFVEVLQNLKTIQKNFKDCKAQILEYQPDAVIFVDYPGFNLRMAKWAKENHFRTFYFISPNVWAWKSSRVYKIRDYVDKLFVILPFEKEFYKKYNIGVEYYGNPLVDLVNSYKPMDFKTFCDNNNLSGKPIIILMPGSRKQEIKKMLPIMVKVSNSFKDYEFVIAGAPAIDRDFYETIIGTKSDIKILFNQTYEILSHSTSGLITSGTATLEAALFRVPQVVCYKANAISVMIARIIAKVKYISLVNLILNKMAVKELIQNDFTEQTTIQELEKILANGENNVTIKNDYEKLYSILNNPDIYKSIAERIIAFN